MSGQTYSGRVGRDGSFAIQNVPPGRYLAFARSQTGRGGGGGGGEQDLSGVLPVTVSGQPVNDLSLLLSPGTTVAGQVVFEGAAAPTAQDFTRVRVSLWTPANSSLPMFASQLTTTTRQDGSFIIPNVPAGTRMLRASFRSMGSLASVVETSLGTVIKGT